LARQLPVWVCVGKAEDGERFAHAVELSRSIAVPGIAATLESGTTKEGAPYLATRRLGRGANEVILAQGTLGASGVPALCGEAVRILAALADAGVQLPDARYRRFAVDESGRLWLRDLMDAQRADPEAARTAHAALGRELCLDVFARSARFRASDAVLESVRSAESCVILASILDRMG
jgi:hypothetical protein